MSGSRIAWIALGVAVAVAIVVAVSGASGGHETAVQRADAIAANVRCPTCRGQSVLESAAPAAQAIRLDIRHRIAQGQSRRQIEDYLVGRYGSDILLTPPRNGVGGLVWVLPVVAVVAAVGGLTLSFQRWSRTRRAWGAPT